MATLRASVAPLGHELDEIFEYSATIDDMDAPVHILVLLVGRGIDAAWFDNLLNIYVMPRLVDDVDAIVFRIHPSSAPQVRSEILQRGSLRRRFPQTPVGLLSTDVSDELQPWDIDWLSGSLEDLNNRYGASLDGPQVLSYLRNAELALYAASPGAMLPANEHYHYEAPSGSHYRSYFRGGFALSLKDHIDGLAFWLWPQVPRGCLLVVDNPTLVAAALGFVDYARRELGFSREDLPDVESRDHYGEPPAVLASRLSGLAIQDPVVVVMSSIVSTGASLAEISEACEQAGFSDVRSVVLFSEPADRTEHPLHFLQHELGRVEGECEICTNERSPVVKISKRSLLVESSLVREARISIGPAQGARDFFSRYASSESAVSVHRDQHDERRHHIINIDVGVLCDSGDFVRRLEDGLEKWRGLRVAVLHPRHDAAVRLARETERFLGAQRVGAEPHELATLPPDDRLAIRASDLLLIVDDASITGSRLRQYRAQLNATALVSRGGRPKVGFVVGIMRPASAARRRGITDMVDRGDDGLPLALAVEEMLLPDWQTWECPWCRELQELTDFGGLLDDGLLAHRHRQLSRTSDGLVRDLFLPWSAGTTFAQAGGRLLPPENEADRQAVSAAGLDPNRHIGTEQLDLGPLSILGDLRTEAQVFVAVASSLQFLRSEGVEVRSPALNESFNSLIGRVLTPESYLSGRFYAPVILGAVLRASRRYDLRAPAIESRLRRQVGERLTDSAAVRAEILYAIRQGVLPKPSELRDVGTYEGCDPNVLAFLDGSLPNEVTEPL